MLLLSTTSCLYPTAWSTVCFCCSLIGPQSWPITSSFVASLHEVSAKLSDEMYANCTTELLPSPLAYSSTRGLGLMETRHLAGAPFLLYTWLKRIRPHLHVSVLLEHIIVDKHCASHMPHPLFLFGVLMCDIYLWQLAFLPSVQSPLHVLTSWQSVLPSTAMIISTLAHLSTCPVQLW